MTLFNTLKADFLKLKHSTFFFVHLIVPLIVLVIFESYMKISTYNTHGFTAAFFVVISLGFPLIIATVTSIISEQEIEAGGGMWMLSVPSRRTSLESKLFFLLLFSLLSCEFAACGFGLITPFIRDDFSVSFDKLIEAGLLLWSTSFFNYLLLFFISLKFTRTVNFVIATISVLIGTLFLTGLGDILWIITPSAWGARLVSIFFNASIEGQISSFSSSKLVVIMIIISTMLGALFLFTWFSKWEGRKQEE